MSLFAHPSAGWLCPTDADRQRMLDMGSRVRRARMIAMGAMGAGMAAVSPVIGWPMIPVWLVALAAMLTLDARVRRAARPEGVIARTILLMVVLTGVSAALTGGATSPVLPLVAVPIAVAAARFRAQVVWAFSGAAMAVAFAASATSGLGAIVDTPLMLVSVAVLLVAVTAATTALMDAELQYRSESVLDPLTGLLNRAGLEARFAELAEQARLLEQPMCLVLCDLDHFKRVNDGWGHERGDTVLRDVAYAMRKHLRSFELFYRLGGEEFLVLFPGLDLASGVAMAETLRAAVEEACPAGLSITASFGVSAGAGEDLAFLSLYRAADDALYRSKHDGRNRVAAAGFPTLVAGRAAG